MEVRCLNGIVGLRTLRPLIQSDLAIGKSPDHDYSMLQRKQILPKKQRIAALTT
jgi:hypothetical protein